MVATLLVFIDAGALCPNQLGPIQSHASTLFLHEEIL